jgi:hypothetical protein
MKYKILHEFPNRLRIRCGRYAFTEKEGYGIENLLLNFKYIQEVTSSHRNGSLTIKYANNDKKNILDFIKNIKIEDLKEIEPNEEQTLRKIDSDFQIKLIKIILKRTFIKLFLPYPLEILKIFYDSIPFIKEGLKSLWNFRMDVCLLDSVAICGSLIMKSFVQRVL